MTERKPQEFPSPTAKWLDRDLLESWKEIAVFFKRDVRTVQLWEQHERMPVHRHVHRKLATVHAYRSELGAWWNKRCETQNLKESISSETPALHTPKESPVSRSIACAIECVQVGTVTQGKERVINLRREIESRIQLLTQWWLAPTPDDCETDARSADRRASDWEERGIHYLLSGMMLEAGHRYQVNLQLTCLSNRNTVWSRQFAGDVRTIAEQQSLADRVALSVGRCVLVLPHSVSAGEATPAAARYAYLRGRYFWSMRSQPEAIKRAMEQFKLATELDPRHARSYAGLADCYIVMSWLAMLPRDAAVSNAKRAATQALALDATLSEAHVSLASILFDFEWDWKGAEREFLHGIRLNPSNAQAYQWYGESLSILGADEHAIEVAQRAQEVDPASAVVASFLGYALYRSDRTQEAMAQYHYALNMDADCMVAHTGLGLANIQEERFDEAIDCFGKARSLSDYPDIRAMMAHAYALKGDKVTAGAMLAQLAMDGHSHNTPVLDIAATYVAMHDIDAAFECLHAGMKRRNVRLTKLRRDPRLRPLHSDGRFDRLVNVLRMP